MRFLMVDRVTQLEPDAGIEGFKCWSISNDVFRDHFPGMPIVPGVLLVESGAQLAGIFLKATYRERYGPEDVASAILTIIHKAKFRQFVLPGDRVDMAVKLLSMDRHRASCRFTGRVEDELRVEADLSFVMSRPSEEPLTAQLRAEREAYERWVLEGPGLRGR